MSHQYIHTSAKRGLEPGKSGFCCVARDRSAPLDLIQEFERLSRYESVSGAISPTVLRYEICELRSGTYHILSRIQDSGVDYSKRNNHIAQHLAFLPREIGFLPDPMTILLCWRGWRDSWNELPRILELEDAFDIKKLDTKRVISNHPNEFPDLIVNGLVWKRTLIFSPGEELAAAAWIRLHLLHVPNDQKWEIPFSTHLLSSDNPDSFAWSCNWKNRELPYEIDTEGQPWVDPEQEEEPELEEEPHENTLQKLRKPNSPIVEIPKELTRRDRKRPKAKWTQSRFNSTMNLAIIAGTLICVAIGFYQFVYMKEPVEKMRIAAQKQKLTPEEKAAQEESERRQLQSKTTQEWLLLHRQRELLKRSSEATVLANTLAELGDTEPRKTLQFLSEAVRSSQGEPYPVTPALALPPEYLKFRPRQVEIDNELSTYLAELNLSFLPQKLLDIIQSLESLSINSAPIEGRLSPIVFVAADIEIAIKEIRRRSRDSTITKDLKAWNSIISFNELKESIAKQENLQDLLSIHHAFGLDDSNRYLTYDNSGRVLLPGLLSYNQYLLSLFEKYMLPRYAQFKGSPEFTETLNTLKPDSTIQTNATRLLEIARPTDMQTQLEWQTIADTWKATFVKDDLMQQTLLNYAVEQLQESKTTLSAYQSEFSKSQYESFKQLQSANNLLADLEALVANSSEEQDWVVIPKEILNAPQKISSSH
ncbi:hypothetical protein MLD52_09485 [Puniceicoccaceae bacterium K14]|nr:hypothetical protein [Puniceicoccaceae bacterium K14]